jgi:hypothetical protein
VDDRWPRLFKPLRHRDFRLLWTGQTVAIGDNRLDDIEMADVMAESREGN